MTEPTTAAADGTARADMIVRLKNVVLFGYHGVSAAEREVGSPCNSTCVLDPGLGYCIGCFRTLDEITDWVNLDSVARLAVWDAIAQRRKASAA